MTRFFIDSDDGAREVIDRHGFEYPDPESALEAAYKTLHDMARDQQGYTGRRRLAVSIRNGEGSTIYAATLSFEGRIADPDDEP